MCTMLYYSTGHQIINGINLFMGLISMGHQLIWTGPDFVLNRFNLFTGHQWVLTGPVGGVSDGSLLVKIYGVHFNVVFL